MYRGKSTIMEIIKRNKCLKVRFTSLEYEIIKNLASKSGMQMAPFCREKALGHRVALIKTHEEVEAYEMLTKFYNNFEGIKKLWRDKDSAVVKEIIKTCQEIKQHLKRLRDGW